MSDALKHPATGDPIELAEGEQLWKIDWPGKPVLVISRMALMGRRNTGWRTSAASPGTRLGR
jgi:hypothetical protein